MSMRLTLFQCARSGAALLATLAWCGHAAAQQPERAQQASEVRVQAAYLLKFAGYVEWPPARPALTPAVVAVVNDDDMADEAQRIAARMPAATRPIVKTLRANESLDGVHVLYVGGDDWPRYQRWVQQAIAHTTLLVSAHPGALDYGSMINFKRVEDRVRFEVSTAASDNAHLKIGAPLMALAVAVNRGK